MVKMTEAQTQIVTADDPMVPRIMRVKRRQEEIRDTWTLELEPEADDPGFAPGQFNMLYIMGVGEIPISMSGDPDKAGLVHTIRAVGAVSEALAGLKKNDTLGIRGPFGSDWPLSVAKGKDVVLMAGGIGLAPLRPLLYQLLAAPEDFGRIIVLYGSRSPADILFEQQLEQWRAELPIRIDVTVDHAQAGWNGNVGVVTDLVKPDLFDPNNAVAYLCGPEVMMRYSIETLMNAGLPADAIYLSMERNMKCAIGHCGHCQFGPTFICKDGPVFRYDQIRQLFGLREF